MLEAQHKLFGNAGIAHSAPTLRPRSRRLNAVLTQSLRVRLLGQHRRAAGGADRPGDEGQILPTFGAEPVVGGDEIAASKAAWREQCVDRRLNLTREHIT